MTEGPNSELNLGAVESQPTTPGSNAALLCWTLGKFTLSLHFTQLCIEFSGRISERLF